MEGNSMAKQNVKNFDDIGIFTLPFDEYAPKYNAKKLSEYCKKHNKKPSELTELELKSLQSK